MEATTSASGPRGHGGDAPDPGPEPAGPPAAASLPLPRLEEIRSGLEDAVRAAGEAIAAVAARRLIRVGHKRGEGPVSEADYAADAVLRRELTALYPEAHWLSEESAQGAPLVPGEATWVVDPLDGTREFLRGLPEFGVSVGLFLDDRPVLGAVYIPGERRLLSGLPGAGGPGARLDGEPLGRLARGAAVERVVVSRHDYEWRRLHYQIPFPVYPCGSAAVKLAHVACGRADVYLSTGPRSVWDVAGGAAVLRAVGGDLVGFDGRPLRLSPQQVGVPPFAAGEPAACRALLRRLGARL
ncbi:MAG: 3'(2'),5'-bisphosphate nucleotidase CysQ [Chloroflexi bacterium]|nr:3'(2'),5'-bisphosphate nucleotidase CysQ [Chloroflexota bacterium]